jgi:hypothetical protein
MQFQPARFWKIILPSPSTLGRLAAAVGSTGRQEILDRIAARLTEPIAKAIDNLLTVEEGAGRSPLFDFKEFRFPGVLPLDAGARLYFTQAYPPG